MTSPSKRRVLVTLAVAVVAVLGMVAVPASVSASAGDTGVSPFVGDTGVSPFVGDTGVSPTTHGVGAGSPVASSVDVVEEDIVHECAATPPDDFSDPEAADNEDVVGWVDGYWYNEPLEIDTEDGLTEEELEKLSARTAARFEAMRCLSLKEMPTVEVLTRDEYREELEGLYEGVDDETRMYDNAKLATTLKVGQDEDSIDVREESQAVTVGGFYNFEEERIVVITDDPDALPVDEVILAHELGHAIQDQHFDLGEYNRNTTDLDKAKLGVIEGDVHWVEHEYLHHCREDNWNEPCIVNDGTSGDDTETQEPPNWGIYFKDFQPYSDGPTFVEHVYEEGDGWDDVDALYDDMPRNSTEVISPEQYGEFEPEELTVEDESDDDWERLVPESQPESDVIGQAGITGAFMAPTYETERRVNVLNPNNILNMDGTQIDEFNPLNYDHPETDGWQGDRMYVYHDDDERTATVWKTAWETPEEAEQFADAYGELIDYRGGESVGGYDGVYTFEEESEFDQALSVQVEGDRVWIVTAPTVSELDAVHDGAAVEGAGTPTPEPADTSTPTPQAGEGTPTPALDDVVVPGFGVVVALVALLLATLALRRQ